MGEACNFTNDLVCLVVASSELPCLVRVVGVFHGAVLLEVIVVVGHPAAVAAPAAPVIIIVGTALIMSQCAVNTLLLGESDGG